jgi:hypothetical protein
MEARTIIVSTDHVPCDSFVGIQCEDEDTEGIREIDILNWAISIGGNDRVGVPAKVREVSQPFGGVVTFLLRLLERVSPFCRPWCCCL